MTDLAKEKEATKKNIRSLLLSVPLGLSLQDLKRDYIEFFGEQLPFRKLGYNDLESLLYDLPDAVEVFDTGAGITLKAVSDATTRHIEKLVSNQKISSKSRSRRGRSKNNYSNRPGSNFLPPPPASRFSRYGHGGGSGNQRGWQPPAQPPPVLNFGYGPNRREQSRASLPPRMRNYRQAQHRTLPQVPAYIRSQIQELIDPHLDGLPLTHICQIFRSRFGVPLDPRALGFTDEYELLSSLRDIVNISRLEGGEMRVMPIDAPKTKKSSNKSSSLTPYNGPVNKTLSQSTSPNDKQQELKSQSKSRATSSDRQQKEESETEKENATQHSCNLPIGVQENIRQIMLKRKKGIFASRLPFEYKDMFKIPLPLQTYGYNSVIEFVSDLPHIIRIERPHPQGDWHLFPVHSIHEEKPRRTSESATTCAGISGVWNEVEREVKETILQVMLMNPNGIPVDKFIDTYQEMTGSEFDISRYGDGDIKGFVRSLSDILYLSLDEADRAIVCSKVVEAPRKFDRLNKDYQPTVHTETDDPNLIHLPDDAVSPGCFYRPLSLPAPDSYIELYVSNVISPSIMWIQLRGKKHAMRLDDYMDELDKVYSNKRLSKGYGMTPALAQKGMVCAVIFPEDGNWHRGIIMDKKDQLYKVYYVDYGNSCMVSIGQMRLLKTKFMKLPAQAIQARLANIQPNGIYTVQVRDRLLDLCGDKPLIGLVSKVEDRVLSLCLTDTSKEEDIHINDLLVSEGYSVFVRDGDTSKPKEKVPVTVLSQAPSQSFLYGDSQSVAQGSSASEPTRRYVREVQLPDDHSLHLINVEGELYVMSAQLSALFFSEDVISAKLRKHGLTVPHETVSKEWYPDLFQELMLYEIPNITESTSLLSLYAVKGMFVIIECFGEGEQAERLKEVTSKILNWFNPQDPYWMGEDEGGDGEQEGEDEGSMSESGTQDDTQSSTGDGSDLPSMDNLKLVLNTLSIKRKRILAKMMKGEGDQEENVNELNQIEMMRQNVEALIKKLQSKSGDGEESMSNPQMSMSASSEASKLTSQESSSAPDLHSQSSNPQVSATAAGITQASSQNHLSVLAQQQQQLINRMLLEQAQLTSLGQSAGLLGHSASLPQLSTHLNPAAAGTTLPTLSSIFNGSVGLGRGMADALYTSQLQQLQQQRLQQQQHLANLLAQNPLLQQQQQMLQTQGALNPQLLQQQFASMQLGGSNIQSMAGVKSAPGLSQFMEGRGRGDWMGGL